MAEQLSLTSVQRSVVGDRITKIRRVHYVRGDTIESRNGPVEVTVGDRAPLVFDAGPDGEELVCREGPWIDPFADVGAGADPESEAENARYVAEYGKRTVFDPGEGSDVSALVGRKIQALTVDTVADGKPVTALFDLGGRSLVLAARGDELVTIVWKR